MMKNSDDLLHFLEVHGQAVESNINHREHDYNGFRFKFGWSSNVPGWILYDVIRIPEES